MTDATTAFAGFPVATFKFFEQLKKNNNRDWFNDHKPQLQADVYAPAQAFIEALGKRLSKFEPRTNYDTATNGRGSMFRLHRDVRFSKDKSPYKINLGIFFWVGDNPGKMNNPGWYFHLAPDECWFHAGMYQFPKDKLARYRDLIGGDPKHGKALKQALVKVKKADCELAKPHYKRVPRGCDPEHPHVDLLLNNSLGTSRGPIPRNILTGADCVDVAYDFCKASAPLVRWVTDHL